MPDIPPRPRERRVAIDLDPESIVKNGRRLTNGLSPRADAMARFVAHGATYSDAFRTAYNVVLATPRTIAGRAGKVAANPKFRTALLRYASDLEEEGRQTSFEIRDFVMSRLVTEAQHADAAAARIRATELLGKTEGMFVDVRRTEKTIDPASLDKLKAQLEQRLRAALSRLGGVASLTTGTADSPAEGQERPMATPTVVEPPLIATGPMLPPTHTIPLKQGPISASGTPISSPPVGVDSDFAGPLFLQGGLRG